MRTTGDPERSSISPVAIGTTEIYDESFELRQKSVILWRISTVDHRRECPDTRKCTHFAHRCGKAEEMTTDCCRARFGGEHKGAIARAELAEAQKDSIHHGEGCDMLCQTGISDECGNRGIKRTTQTFYKDHS